MGSSFLARALNLSVANGARRDCLRNGTAAPVSRLRGAAPLDALVTRELPPDEGDYPCANPAWAATTGESRAESQRHRPGGHAWGRS